MDEALEMKVQRSDGKIRRIDSAEIVATHDKRNRSLKGAGAKLFVAVATVAQTVGKDSRKST